MYNLRLVQCGPQSLPKLSSSLRADRGDGGWENFSTEEERRKLGNRIAIRLMKGLWDQVGGGGSALFCRARARA